jgi:CheY-like chemotaxis protein
VEILVHAATAAGDDVAVVAHPDVDVAQSLASGVARFGYRTVLASTGRDAILAARASADTVLVIIAARLARPTALETVEFLRNQGTGGEPPVLVVVDPLDDDGRGCFLQRMILTFRDEPGVAIVDGLDSFFAGARDADTGEFVLPPRFHDALARCAGPAAVDPAAREAARAARFARAGEALALLARLGRRGQDVSAALDTARLALVDPDRADSATTLLAAIGRPAAQRALAAEAARAEVAPATRELALAAFAVSRQRYGLLLGRSDLETLLVNYTHDPDAAVRQASAAIIDVIETPRTIPASAPLDVAPARLR